MKEDFEEQVDESKTVQEKAALQIAAATDNPIKKQLAMAVAKSNRIMAEDIIREVSEKSLNYCIFIRCHVLLKIRL